MEVIRKIKALLVIMCLALLGTAVFMASHASAGRPAADHVVRGRSMYSRIPRNPYERGCSMIFRCRHPNPPPKSG
ncbi:hypothetical protein L484_026384 [Morus notabilis]|uniref:Uncharacterized protein n=1 Tax=Morus notabilis TaxID=981085 RepID=W9RL77_9ROSA|nr:hypothetical protein L484_026384 [Morus notabilis]